MTGSTGTPRTATVASAIGAPSSEPVTWPVTLNRGSGVRTRFVVVVWSVTIVTDPAVITSNPKARALTT